MLSLLLIMSAAAPVQFEDLALLDKNIQIQANTEPVDKRLKLAKCPDAPVIIPAIDGGAVVRCLALGWRLHVAARAPNAMDAGADIVIRKGDIIECITNGPGFAVSAQMIALDDARIGQSLRVKSLTSATPMTAMAKARGLAII